MERPSFQQVLLQEKPLSQPENFRSLHIAMTGLGIFNDRAGGSSTHMTETARLLARKGHRVTAMVPRRKGLPVYEEREGVKIHRYDAGGGPIQILRASQGFGNLYRQDPFDLLVIHFPYSGFGPLLNLKSWRTPVIFQYHGPWPKEWAIEHGTAGYRGWINKAQYAIENHILRRSHIVIPDSGVFVPDILEYGTPSNKISPVPIGIDVARFHPPTDKRQEKQALGFNPDTPLFFCVRRLVKRMGLENLVEAFKEVHVRHPQAMLVIGGKGPLAEPLEEQIQSLGLEDCVKLAGFIADEDLPRYYQAADAFVLPTIDLEGFGIVTIESLASGTPVLATAVGGSVDILKPFAPQCLIENTSPQAIAAKLNEFLSQRGKFPDAATCRQTAETRFSWDIIIPQLEQLYLQTAATGRFKK